MRTLYFLVPGTGGKFACGGLWAELKTLALAQQICEAKVVTYRQREKDTLFLDDVLRSPDLDNTIFVISWGFDVPKLAARLKSYNTVYHAHSAGYGFDLSSRIPIITVSRNTMGYWGQRSPHALIYYLPNQISDEFSNRHLQRDIDVLVQARKSSDYLLHTLVPAVREHCTVHVVDSYVDDLPGLFNRARIYLYDSAEYWAMQGVSEGFGLQPMEAMACGCQVFSSVNGGLSDYLDPEFNSHKIAVYSVDYDVQRILKAIRQPSLECNENLFLNHRFENILPRLQAILVDINAFFNYAANHPPTIDELTPLHIFQMNSKRIMGKLTKRFLKQ